MKTNIGDKMDVDSKAVCCRCNLNIVLRIDNQPREVTYRELFEKIMGQQPSVNSRISVVCKNCSEPQETSDSSVDNNKEN